MGRFIFIPIETILLFISISLNLGKDRMTLDFWSIAIIIIIFQGFFFASVLLLSSKKRALARNSYLVALIFLFIWFLAEFLSVRNVYKVDFDLFYGTRYGSWLLLGPLTYFFFKSITATPWRFKNTDIVHFVPFLLFVVLIPLISGQSLSSRQIHYGMLAVFDHRPKTVSTFEYLYSNIFYVQFLHLGGYLFFNFKVIRIYTIKLKNTYSNIDAIIWLKIFNISLIVTLVLAAVYLYILFESDAYHRSLDYIYVLPMGFFIYSVGYRLSGIDWLPVDPSPKKYSSSSLKKHQKSAYIRQLETLMDHERPYLKNDLRIKDLASKLGVSTHHLSQLLNEHYHCSFFDYINRFRVNEAKRIIVAQPKRNLLKIAFEAGFNNKTSFVNAFKKFEQKTPSTFRKETQLPIVR